MATQYAFGKIVTNGLVLALDAADRNSYPGSGTTWRDLSGNGNNETLTNGPVFSSANGGSFSFDGVDDFSGGNVTSIANTAFTISSWIRTGAITSDRIYLSIGSNGNTREAIHLRFLSSTTALRFGLYGDDLDATITNASLAFTNIVCVLNSSFLQSIYQNGSFITSRTAGGFYVGNNTIRLGNWGLNNSEFFLGNIASTSIYNRALTAQEILQNYNAQKSRFGL